MDIELNNLFIIGIIFFFGLAADVLGRKTSIPRVTFLIITGIILGPSVLNILPKHFVNNWFETITIIALGMVGFLLGQQFTLKSLKDMGKTVFSIAIGKVLFAFLFISITLVFLFNIPFEVSLILASIATATAPAAVYETVNELKIDNKFSKKLLAIVAFDDILALFLFSLVLAFVGFNNGSSDTNIIANGFYEIFGSIILGFISGYPVAKITGRLNGGEPLMVEALGSVFIMCGAAIMLGLSPILTTLALGSSVATFASHHSTPFHAIKNIEWPFMILFFLLAGASLDIAALLTLGSIGIVYIFMRILGIYIGAKIGAKISNANKNIQNYIGLALIPQAGVAIGMALMASHKFEQFSSIILPIVLGTTVFFEIIGPVATRYALKKTRKD
ncbi:MAG: cation:proton antiporter [Campylobacterota bacterium]|nr:cation:proton antiporter [Campylobacterota bacterium]